MHHHLFSGMKLESSQIVFILFLFIFIAQSCAFSSVEILKDFHENTKSEKCKEELGKILVNLEGKELWALEFVDAWAKGLPAGTLFGNTVDFGNYDECLRIKEGEVQGQYCTVSFEIPTPTSRHYEKIDFNILPKNTNSNNLSITLGVCIPSSCEPQSIYDYAKEFLLKNYSLKIIDYKQDDFCSLNDEISFTFMDVITIIIFILIGTCLTISTLYELWMLKQGRQGHPLGLLFSVYSNGRKIFTSHTFKSPEILFPINGIRVISLMWIIFAHSYVTVLMNPLINKNELGNWVTKYHSMMVLGSSVAVDTFLLLSGMLVCWVLLRALNRGLPLNLPKIYIHRYFRLTPAFAILVLLNLSTYRHFGSGPLWKRASDTLIQPCQRNWWSALLFIQNYMNPEDICLGHSWYLSVDMQLFVLAPFIVWPLYKWKRRVLLILIAMIGASVAAAFYASYEWELRVSAMQNIVNGTSLLKGKLLYYPTHVRMGAWLIGVILGWILFTTKGKRVHLSKATVGVGWSLAVSSCVAIVFGMYNFQQEAYQGPIYIDAFYESLIRVTWSLAISWIIFACVNGYGSIVNDILSFRVWKPLGKLSYSAYLLHYPVQIYLMSTTKNVQYFSDIFGIHKFWGDFMMTVCGAVVWMLAFEMPIIELENFFLRRQEGNFENEILENSEEA